MPEIGRLLVSGGSVVTEMGNVCWRCGGRRAFFGGDGDNRGCTTGGTEAGERTTLRFFLLSFIPCMASTGMHTGMTAACFPNDTGIRAGTGDFCRGAIMGLQLSSISTYNPCETTDITSPGIVGLAHLGDRELGQRI